MNGQEILLLQCSGKLTNISLTKRKKSSIDLLIDIIGTSETVGSFCFCFVLVFLLWKGGKKVVF